MGPKCARLSDICTGSIELHSELTDSLRIFAANLGSPVTCADVAALFQVHDVASIAKDHLAAIEAVKDALRNKNDSLSHSVTP